MKEPNHDYYPEHCDPRKKIDSSQFRFSDLYMSEQWLEDHKISVKDRISAHEKIIKEMNNKILGDKGEKMSTECTEDNHITRVKNALEDLPVRIYHMNDSIDLYYDDYAGYELSKKDPEFDAKLKKYITKIKKIESKPQRDKKVCRFCRSAYLD